MQNAADNTKDEVAYGVNRKDLCIYPHPEVLKAEVLARAENLDPSNEEDVQLADAAWTKWVCRAINAKLNSWRNSIMREVDHELTDAAGFPLKGHKEGDTANEDRLLRLRDKFMDRFRPGE